VITSPIPLRHRLGLALWLGLLLLSVVPAQAQSTIGGPAYCNKYFQVNQAAVALTKVISGVAAQSIQLCGWSLSGGAAAATASLSYGTGANCGTGTVVLQPLVNVAINGSYVDHVPFVNQIVPVANDLCLVTTGTGPLSVIIYYAQF